MESDRIKEEEWEEAVVVLIRFLTSGVSMCFEQTQTRVCLFLSASTQSVEKYLHVQNITWLCSRPII